jgi:hypothetical protein
VSSASPGGEALQSTSTRSRSAATTH